jgi:ornithine cyclodeaminase/alanine dehydrogenase-like protein (mu-crystallin family)
VAIRILRAEEVRSLLSVAECIDLMDGTMRAVSEGRATIPLRSVMQMPGDIGALGNMPGYVADPPCFGVKLVSLFPRNKASEFSSHLGVVMLFEAEHGQPVAMLDAGAITAIRTAAASGLATRLLAHADAGDLALLGAGEQAVSHLAAMLAVRPIRRVRLWARDPAKARAFAEREGAHHGITIETPASVAETVAGADIICTLTKARDPLLLDAWVSDGAHINLVGSSIVGAAEIDTALVARARYFVDLRLSAENEAGEFRRALDAGAVIHADMLGEIGEVANGTLPGRTRPDDVTIYKSLGIAPQDLASAHHVLALAEARGIGTVVPF